METLQAITLGIAVLGAVLGVLNTWRTFSNDRVRLRVREHGMATTDGDRGIGIEIVNLSTFPVIISTMGLHLTAGARHIQLVEPFFLLGGKLPYRLEPRAACTAFQPIGALPEDVWTIVKHAYVTTACGVTKTGPGRVFRKLQATG